MSETKCTVVMNNEIHEGEEFVAIIPKENGDAGFYYNTDALSMGMAMQMCARAFAQMLNKLDEREQAEINAILGGGYESQESGCCGGEHKCHCEGGCHGGCHE